MRFAFILLFFLPFYCIAQSTISGKILSGDDASPVAKASVFLSNATVGSSTADDGSFILYNVKPGQYELVVTALGFETYRDKVMAGNEPITLPTIKLKPRSIALDEVVIKPDADWDAKYALFKREFLGESKIAKDCKILNPEVLDMQFGDTKLTLKANTEEFLLIENRYLGYLIKYLLTNFIRDDKKNLIAYVGSTYFEDLPGKPSQVKRWQKNRQRAFEGSPMHFFRTVLSNRLNEEKFEVLRLVRDSIKKKRLFGGSQYLVNKPLQATEFALRTTQTGIYALKFKDCLYVMYKKRSMGGYSKEELGIPEIPRYEASVIIIDDEYSLFDSNGVLLDPQKTVFEGNWAKSRVAEMLPVDYAPPGTQ